MVVGEFYGSQDGIGNFIFNAGHTLQVDKVLFGAIFITIVALVAFIALQAVENRFSTWRPRFEAR
jgi:ABC-type nitrate/sulfonate/bicarbonate transport system permease component